MAATNDSQLPALLPTAALVLRRTQTTLGLLHDLVQESSAEYWYERGRAAELNTPWGEVAYVYRQCVERDAGHWRGAVRLSAALGHLGQPDAAATSLVEASEVAAEGWDALVTELPKPAWHQLRDGLEAARGTTRDGFGLLLGLALVYRALKQGEQARQTLDVMQFMYEQQTAGAAQWFELSGNMYSHAGSYAKAIVDYDRAIELRPGYASSHYSRGDAKRSWGYYAGAIADYSRAIALKQDYTIAYHRRGITKYNLQNYVGAIADYDRVIELKPSDALAYNNRGVAKDKLSNYVGAIADYNQAIELNPDYAFAYNNRGNTKYNQQNFTGAIADYDQEIALKRDDAISYVNRGNAKGRLEDHAEAMADYNLAIEFNPTNALAYNNRGMAKVDIQDYAGALADYNRAIELQPNNELSYGYRAIVKERLGDITGAAADRRKEGQLMFENLDY